LSHGHYYKDCDYFKESRSAITDFSNDKFMQQLSMKVAHLSCRR